MFKESPPRDPDGAIIPHDHPEILDQHTVIRRITPDDLHTESPTVIRVPSGAFSESSDGGMSVDCEAQMAEDGLEPLHYVPDETHGAVRLRVGDLRHLGLKVGYDPDGGHIHHGAVWGIGTKTRKRILRRAATIRRAKGQTVDDPRGPE